MPIPTRTYAIAIFAPYIALNTISCSNGSSHSTKGGGGNSGGTNSLTTTVPRGGSAPSSTNTGATSVGGSTSVTLANPAPGSKLFVGTNFWRIDWEGAQDFFLPNVDWATVENPWVPQFLTDLEPYTVLRFMDWNLVNEEPNPQATWSTRKKKGEVQTSEPIAYEWQLDLCNRTLKDCWLTVPTGADETFRNNLAQLVFANLSPQLRIYVEYANEVWNGSFPQFDTILTRSTELGLAGTEDWEKVARGYVYESIRLWEAFEKVFGANSPRLVKVLAGQAAWDGPCKIHVAALQDSSINPRDTMPTVYAIAPYFGGTSIDALTKEIPNTGAYVKSHLACVAPLSIPIVGYEGGADSYAAGGSGCVALQHDAAMENLYVNYLDTLNDAGMTGPFNQYTHVGECWGLKEHTTDTPENSPKYRGVLGWLSKHP
jgi:hypothetical protein